MSKQALHIVKIGGNIIDAPEALASFLANFASIKGPKLMVHGGGKIATSMAAELGIQSQMIDGRRVTDADSLRIVTMVYAGWINKSIVASLQAQQCNAIGLAGPDGGFVVAKKRNPVPMDYGFVGDIEKVNAQDLAGLISAGFSPVFAPITADSTGQLLNTNADTMAQALAIGLSDYFDVTLTYCFEKQGVLMDPNDDNSVIPKINQANFAQLKADGIVSAGMIPKLENALKAIAQGVQIVRLCHADFVSQPDKGTLIQA
ncbi:acetylglutamate kinase [Aquirufa sp. LEPPI-3A]|uniref:acetylglutamate kinase n=1 Tax=Aquirufa regiilacus TaxID=3024868 RepID=UPI0028DF0368|nr:acetylglutamate kinase [Aquirufa sp. LEPPI-3A]MDT8887084.1 acetylglutamate kinase [Aquirufa sp. LEPPI-3A]